MDQNTECYYGDSRVWLLAEGGGVAYEIRIARNPPQRPVKIIIHLLFAFVFMYSVRKLG